MPVKFLRKMRTRLLARVLRSAILTDDHVAIRRTAEVLRKAHLSLDLVVGENGEPPVLLAVRAVADRKVRQDTLKATINAGFRVDEESKDSIGLRPVYVATQTQRSDILEVLLAAGADPNLATGDNRVPLLTACQTGNVTCTRMLLKAGADPNTPTPRLKGTPLHLVAQSGHENARKLCQLLVDAGCDVTRRNFFGKTALHSACGSRRDVTKIIDFLLLHGEDINGRDERGQTPLMHAASLDNVRTVQYLIQQNADKTCRDSEGRSALDVAMEKKFKEVVLSLADHKS